VVWCGVCASLLDPHTTHTHNTHTHTLYSSREGALFVLYYYTGGSQQRALPLLMTTTTRSPRQTDSIPSPPHPGSTNCLSARFPTFITAANNEIGGRRRGQPPNATTTTTADTPPYPTTPRRGGRGGARQAHWEKPGSQWVMRRLFFIKNGEPGTGALSSSSSSNMRGPLAQGAVIVTLQPTRGQIRKKKTPELGDAHKHGPKATPCTGECAVKNARFQPARAPLAVPLPHHHSMVWLVRERRRRKGGWGLIWV
jgi:hypothetical protein